MSANKPVPLEELRLLRLPQVLELVPLSASRIRQLEGEGRFPKRIALGECAVAWRASEVAEWLSDRIKHGTLKPKGIVAAQAKPVRKATARKGA